MSTLYETKISTDDAAWIAKALLAATLRKPYEVRHHIHLRVLGSGELVATAADGFRTHQVHLHLFAAPEPHEFTMPVDALKWLQKACTQFKADADALMRPEVTIAVEMPDDGQTSLDPGDVAIIVRGWDDPSAPSVRFDCRLIPGEYPPYWRTIETLHAAPAGEPSRLPLGHLGAAANLHHEGTVTPTIHYTQTDRGKPGLALLTFWEGETLRAEAAITPNRDPEDDE